ncbi:MAG: GNAT family N-acetyltransferase [Burkholderiaceae bacterium]
MTILIHSLRLQDPADAQALVDLLDLYARGPTGKGEGLSPQVRQALPDTLNEMPHYRGWLAQQDGTPVGLLNAFIGLSTFRAQQLLNIHDLCVRPGMERQGIGSQLICAAEAWARSNGFCKLTLEVLEHHSSAVSAYEKAGFQAYQLSPELGRALFFEKLLD